MAARLRLVTAQRVFDTILAHGAHLQTLADFSKASGLSRRTVTAVFALLEAEDVVLRAPIRLGPQAGLMLSLWIGTESARCAIVDANGDMYHGAEATPHADQLTAGRKFVLGRLRDLSLAVLERALADAQLTDHHGALPMLGVSVAWPTPVDRRGYGRGYAFGPANDWGQAPLWDEVARSLGGIFEQRGRSHAINEAHAAALAVAFDRARAHTPGTGPLLALRVGGRIGVGSVVLAELSSSRLSFLDARLITGSNGLAGELDHLPIPRSLVDEINDEGSLLPPIDYDGARCSCGRRGHLEAFASTTAFMRRMSAAGVRVDADGASTAELQRIIHDPDALPAHGLHDIGRILGRALAGTFLVLDPHNLTICGALASPRLAEGIWRQTETWTGGRPDALSIDVLEGEWNAFAEVRGAALATIRARVYRTIADLLDPAHRQVLTAPFTVDDIDALDRDPDSAGS